MATGRGEFKRGHLGLLKTRPGLFTKLCRVLRTLHPLFARPGGLFCYYHVAPVGRGGTCSPGEDHFVNANKMVTGGDIYPAPSQWTVAQT